LKFTSSKLNSFDAIAPWYDALAKVVYGKAIQKAQSHFINEIKEDANVLILGGGTGWLLSYLLLAKPNCKVWYLEASAKMIELTTQKIHTSSSVQLIHGTEDDIPTEIRFDAVITNFYLDLFPIEKLNLVIKKIKNSLKPNSKWLATDFVDGSKWWQAMLLKAMYLFFRIVCRIPATKLPDWNGLLMSNGVQKIKSKLFYQGFIESTIYRSSS